MIAYLTYLENASTILLDSTIIYTNILEKQLRFIQIKNGYSIRVDKEIEINQKGPFYHGDIASLKIGGTLIQIYFSQYSEKYLQFKKYQLKDSISISNFVDSDIYLQDSNLKNLIIDYQRQKSNIKVSSREIPVSLDGKLIRFKDDIQPGDILKVLNLTIIFHTDFIMINDIENVYVSLSVYKSIYLFGNLLQPTPLKRSIIHRSVYPGFNEDLTANLISPEGLQKKEQQPILLSIGPMLMMSFATFSVSAFSVFQGYLSGKQLIELVPTFLFPIVLIFSTIFWIPMQRIYEYFHYQSKMKTRSKKYSEYLEYEYQKQLTKVIEKNNYLQSQLISYEDFIKQQFDYSNLWKKAKSDFDWLWIYLGQEAVIQHFQYNQSFHLDSKDPIYSLITIYKQKERHLSRCFYIPLKQYKHIFIKPSALSENLFLYFIFQLVFYYSAEELKLQIYCDSDFINKNCWLYHLPHLRGRGKRSVYIQSDAIRKVIIDDKEKIECSISMPNSQLSKEDILIEVNEKVLHVKNIDGVYTVKNDLKIKLPYELLIHKMKRFEYDVKEMYHFEAELSFYDLHNIECASDLNILNHWNQEKCIDGIKAMIGIDQNGNKMTLDLHEKGDGPHGLLAGTTGSGKSEFIITLLLSLAIRYSPEELQFVLLDFKGGGASTSFYNQNFKLPHISSVLTNLDTNSMEKAIYSLSFECQRRQKYFINASNISDLAISDIDSYQNHYSFYPQLPRLSHILIIVDEFAELKRIQPEFLSELVSIARIGRSLGIHLLLSTQKPSGIIDEQIWSNSHFKICLKVQTRQDSNEVLHDPSAAEIENAGEFYIYSNHHLKHGKVAYSAAKQKNSNYEVILYQPDQSIQEKTNTSIHCKTELYGILEEISHLQYKESQYQIWLDTPERNYNNEQQLEIGYTDNYYNHSLDSYQLFDIHRNMIVFGAEDLSIRKFTELILHALFQKIEEDDEIYLFYKNFDMVEKFKNCAQVIEVCHYSDEEKMNNIIKHIKERRSKNHIYCICLDYSDRSSERNEHNHILKIFIEESIAWNLYTIFCCRGFHMINYRFFSFFKEKISLYNDDIQELSSIFEMRVQKPMNKKNCAYIKKEGKLLTLHFSSLENDNFEETIKRQESKEKKIKIQAMPKNIFYSSSFPNGLGVSLENYQWVERDITLPLFVISTYAEELLPFFEFWNQMHHDGLWLKDNENSLNEGITNNRVIFMALYQYQSIRNFKNVPVLYIGEGFSDQYVFQKRLKHPLQPNQAIYFHGIQKQVIQIVQNKNS